MKMNTCCFIGHRAIFETDELKSELYEAIEKLIVERNIDTFLFGSKSRFNTLCLEIVTKIKEKYPYISEQYKNYLLESYEATYYPEKIKGSGKAAYIERNIEMINNSQICIIYYNRNNVINTRKSGTKIALDYAINKNKEIIHFF